MYSYSSWPYISFITECGIKDFVFIIIIFIVNYFSINLLIILVIKQNILCQLINFIPPGMKGRKDLPNRIYIQPMLQDLGLLPMIIWNAVLTLMKNSYVINLLLFLCA